MLESARGDVPGAIKCMREVAVSSVDDEKKRKEKKGARGGFHCVERVDLVAKMPNVLPSC